MKPTTSLRAATVAALSRTAVARVNWGACQDIEVQPDVECGTLQVPLDYTAPDATDTLDLQLLRVPSETKPAKGSVIFNFGGPGVVGRETLAAGVQRYMPLVGGEYDLVSFDPRGTGNTIPISCFENSEARDAAILQNPDVWHGVIAESALWDERSDTARGSFWAMGQIVAEQCFSQHGDQGTLVGTAFTARDMIEIVDALEEDGMLRYWGGSYGTALGATTAYMFPERIGKMVLDGVSTPFEYAYEYHEQQVSDSDKVFSYFFEACLDDQEHCPLEANGTAPADLEKKVWKLLDDIKYRPIAFNNTLYHYQKLKTGLMSGLYGPAQWPSMAAGLDYLFKGNLAKFAEAWAPLSASVIGDANLNSIGIRCSDRRAHLGSFEEFDDVLDVLHERSRFMGGAHGILDASCADWRMTAKERYDGEFHAKTKNPVLVIGNTGDLLTPLASARNVSKTLDGSRLLHHDAYGHASVSHPANCTINTVARYYVNGTLPEVGAKCNPEIPPFQLAASLSGKK